MSPENWKPSELLSFKLVVPVSLQALLSVPLGQSFHAGLKSPIYILRRGGPIVIAFQSYGLLCDSLASASKLSLFSEMSDIKMTIVEKLSYSLIFREKLNNAHFIVSRAIRHGAFSFMNIFRRNNPVVPTQSNHLSDIGFILPRYH